MILPAWYDRERPMLIRIGSGLLGATLYIFLVFWGNGLAFSLGVAVFSVVGAYELFLAVKDRKGGSPSELLGYLACIAFQLSAWAYYGTHFARYLPRRDDPAGHLRPDPGTHQTPPAVPAEHRHDASGGRVRRLAVLLLHAPARIHAGADVAADSAAAAHDAGRVGGSVC